MEGSRGGNVEGQVSEKLNLDELVGMINVILGGIVIPKEINKWEVSDSINAVSMQKEP